VPALTTQSTVDVRTRLRDDVEEDGCNGVENHALGLTSSKLTSGIGVLHLRLRLASRREAMTSELDLSVLGRLVGVGDKKVRWTSASGKRGTRGGGRRGGGSPSREIVLGGSAAVVAIVEAVRPPMAASGVDSAPNEAGAKSKSSSKRKKSLNMESIDGCVSSSVVNDEGTENKERGGADNVKGVTEDVDVAVIKDMVLGVRDNEVVSNEVPGSGRCGAQPSSGGGI
jgi:hypothetical protein